MSDRDHLLATLHDRVRRWPRWRAAHAHTDDFGVYCYRLRHPALDAPAFAVCKRSRHRGKVSVMRRVVDLAAPEATVAVFVGDSPTLGRAYAFDPAVLRAKGSPFRVESKQRVRVAAVEIDPGAWGAVLGDVVGGHADVPTLGVEDTTKQARF